MADRNQLRVHHESDIAETDPFAELTRIMGFDPRHEPTPPVDDDLGIDLERELMGEFGSVADGAPSNGPSPVTPSSEDFDQVSEREGIPPMEAIELDDSFDATFDEMFEVDPVSDPASTAVDEHVETSSHEPMDFTRVEADLADDFGISFDESLSDQIGDDAVAESEFSTPAKDAYLEPEAGDERAEMSPHEPIDFAQAEYDIADDFDEALSDQITDDSVEESQFSTPAEDAYVEQKASDVGDAEVDIDVTGLLSPVDDGYEEPDIEAADAELDIDFTGRLSYIGDARDEPRVAAGDDIDIDFADRRFSSIDDARDEPRVEAADDEVDIDFTGQLSPFEDAESFSDSDLVSTDAEVAGENVSLEDELAALLGVAQPTTAEAVTATGDELAAEYEAPADIEDSYEAQGYANPTAWEPDSAQMPEPKSYEAAQPHFEVASEVQHTAAAEDDFELDFDFEPEAEFGPIDDTPEEEVSALTSSDWPADEMPGDPVPANDVTEMDLDFAEEPIEEADELILDASEFEAALADEFAGPAPSVEEVEADVGEQESGSPEADPFVSLATMGLEPAPQNELQPLAQHRNDAGLSDDRDDPASAVPEIETVEVPEATIALADDLDIPDVSFEEKTERPIAFDDFEADLAQAFDEPSPAPANFANGGRSDPASEEDDFDADFNQLFENGNWDEYTGHVGGSAASIGATATAGAYAGASYAGAGRYETARSNGAASGDYLSDDYAAGDEALGYDPEMDGDIAIPSAGQDAKPSRKRGFVVAALVTGVAIAGGVGAFVYSLGGGDDASPVLVKAEPGPVKIKPENPGGVVVPNQDNKVYERVAGGPVAAPAQEKLISGAEEPVEIQPTSRQPLVTEPTAAKTARAAETEAEPDVAQVLPGVDLAVPEKEAVMSGGASSGKAEDRIDPSQVAEEPAGNDQIAAVQPRKVRTMIVRPDGTLVPREDPAPVAAESAASADAGQQDSAVEAIAASPALVPSTPAANEKPAATGQSSSDADKKAMAEMAAAQPVPAESQAQPGNGQAQVAGATPSPDARSTEPILPARAPVLPSRPADQPMDIIGEVKPRTQVAAAESAAAAGAAAAGGWSMQIASQPTPEGAQATYEDLARRYGSVLDGRGVNIVKAEIAGKGTFWRVRVPVQSRDEAIKLCNRYKGAGGSCFVSQ